MFRLNMHSEALFGAFIIARLTKMPYLLLMMGFCVAVQTCRNFCLVITFVARICDSKVNTGVISMSTSAVGFFFAVIAREFGPWLVHVYKANVFLERMLSSKNPIAMLTSVL